METGRLPTIPVISTGGGAFLELLEGKILPGVAACRKPPPGERRA